MKPTQYLRYVKVEYGTNTPFCIMISFGDEVHCRLQQWWENENGEGEWRFVEYSSKNERPY